jgi:putative oxidoreductase
MSDQPKPIPAKAGAVVPYAPVRPARGLHYHGYALLIGGGGYLQSFVLLLMRLALGIDLAVTGWGHLRHVPDMVKRFTDWGIPMPTASVYISGTTEMIGGALIALGLATRLVSIPLIFNFIVAYATASKGKVHELVYGQDRLNGLNAVIGDDAFPFLMLMLVMLAFGPGKASIDYILQRTIFRRRMVAVPEVSP